MSRRRQKVGENIKRVGDNDRDVARAMNNCHALKREHLNTFIPDERINQFYWDKIFDRIEEPGSKDFIWIKGPNYNDFMAKHLSEIEYRGKASTNQDGAKEHDLGLANHYCFNMTREEQLTCRTEAQQRAEFEEFANTLIKSDDEDERNRGYDMLEDLKENNISMCDFAYTSRDGVEVGYEITTRHYTKEMVEAKQSYCEMVDLQFVAQQV